MPIRVEAADRLKTTYSRALPGIAGWRGACRHGSRDGCHDIHCTPYAAMSTPDPTTSHEAPIHVAVSTKDDKQIDLHFGHADAFAIYALSADDVRRIETREVAHYCQGGYGDEDKREVILRTLADCAALFTARIGDGPKTRLQDAGIEAVDDYPYGLIEPSLRDWFSKR